MATKKTPNIFSLFRGDGQDFDLQAGSHGFSPAEASKRYLKSPGHFLALLRFFREETVENVAERTGIATKSINAFEKGVATPSLMELTSLMEHFRADLRLALEIFGHVQEGASEGSMGIAAQFGGELKEEEKMSLKELVRQFSDKKRSK